MERTTALKADKQVVWHPFTQMQTAPEPLHIVRAQETKLFDSDGKSYIDANSSWWVNVHGHGHPHIAAALSEQFQRVDHIIFAGATHDSAIQLAKRVVDLLPMDLTKVFFSDDGSTAVEVALKMAFQFWHNRGEDRKRVIALEGAYHGDTFGAMSVGARDVFNKPFEPFFFEVDFLDFPTTKNAHALLHQAEELLRTGDAAALIVEPLIQGSAGMRMYPSAFLDQLVSLSKKYETLVIFDEVMTGWGRTGRMFALNYISQVPDMVCLSKGLTGGVLPLGLTVTTQKIYEAFLHDETAKAFLHGHSFTGSALACAAANASLDIFEQQDTWESIERIEEQHLTFAQRLKNNHKVSGIGVCGTILRFEINAEDSGYFSGKRDLIYQHMLDRGILLRPLGNVIYINPPYCITNEELNEIYFAIEFLLENFQW
jgi:adenosylmethionine-8-amino-7-oxononanoate aminotransferase